MARTVRARLDSLTEGDLAVLRRECRSDSEAIRLALHEAAERRRRRSALRIEAELLAANEDDLAEARRVSALMDGLAPPWPED
jgi:hypothetical protein